MAVKTYTIEKRTKGICHIIDITSDASDFIKKSKIKEGIAHLFVVGSTAGLTTVEYEPGLVKDLERLFEKIAPQSADYFHEQTWHDGNGFSHVRASLLKPSLSVPIVGSNLTLGRWQQVILIDFDSRPRNREVVLQIMGEEKKSP